MTRPEVHGHRGYAARFPENTIPSFMAAIEAGADFVELDVQASRDLELIVSHDPRLKTGELIHALNASEIPGCPRLEAVLDLADAGREFGFNIEIKSYPDHPEYGPEPEAMARLAWDAVRARDLSERVLTQSFDFRVLRAMKAIAPKAKLSALWEGHARAFPKIAREAGTASVSPAHGLVTEARVREAHQSGIRVLAWTVNGARAWRKMISAGADGIITDDPAGLVEFLRAGGY